MSTGVIVVSKDGPDRFDADDETTLTIFAGYAAQALVNGTNMERLRRQQDELEHQLEGQRRLLEVNERLPVHARAGRRPRPHRRFAARRSSRTTR